MSRGCALRSILASVVILVLLRAAPAYSWHGTGNITALAIDPVTPTTLYAGTSDRGVFKSTDGGASWNAAGLTGICVQTLAIDRVTPTTLYAATSGGVLKSTDGGVSWNATGLTAASVFALAIDYQIPTTLYAARYGEVLKSTDGGGTWNLVLVKNEYWGTGTFRDLAIDPENPAILYALVNYSTPEQEFGEVLKSTDGGASWSIAILGSGWWDSSPFGMVVLWHLAIAPQTTQTPTTVYVAGIRSESIYGSVFKSTDGGESWIELTITPSPSLHDLAIGPLNPATLYAAFPVAGVDKSMDGGATWSAVNNGLTDTLLAYGVTPGVLTMAIDPVIPTTLYGGTSIGVFKSTDGGASWNPTGLFQHSPLSSVSLGPTRVIGGTVATGTVTLVTAAPAGGITVALSSNNPSVATLPASVTVTAR